MVNLKALIAWLKTSFEDDHNHASHRKLTTFAFTFFVFIMIVLTYINKDPHTFPEVVWASIIAGALGMSYLRAVGQQINRHNNEKNIE